MDILVIPDTQVKPDSPTEHLDWIGQYIVDNRPDVIVHLGDHWDFPSLSSYDKGKKSMEGRRVSEDIVAGLNGMVKLLSPLHKLQKKQKEAKKRVYRPEMHFHMGNHEDRLTRHVEANPELEGFLDFSKLRLKETGWNVHEFLQVNEVGGILFSHYFYQPMSGRAYGGTVQTKLKNVGKSFVMGHQQGFELGMGLTPDGAKKLGIVAGSCYLHDETYKGPQANHHWRGIVLLHDVADGFADVETISLDRLRSLSYE